MWVSEHCLNNPFESVLYAQVGLPTETAKSKEICLASYPASVNYVFKEVATDDNIATVDADTRHFRHSSLIATDYAKQL